MQFSTILLVFAVALGVSANTSPCCDYTAIGQCIRCDRKAKYFGPTWIPRRWIPRQGGRIQGEEVREDEE